MRKRDYLSPSAIKTFYEDIEKYYKMYLSDIQTPRMAQTPAMAIGSGFDAYVKSYLYQAVYGKDHDPRFEREALFETQVEKHNWDVIRPEAEYVFQCYKTSGALTDLLIELNKASESPQFEVELTSILNDDHLSVKKDFDDLTLLGKPDLFYKNKAGKRVVFDWKVNGYYSKYAKSPAPGYLKLRSASGPSFDDKQHKKCVPADFHGTTINGAVSFEDIDADWAAQISIYAWILGEPIGSEFVGAIDQIVCSPCKLGVSRPTLRIAEHRAKITREFQINVYTKAVNCWDIIKSGHIFRDMSLEQSILKCQALDEVNRLTIETPNVHEEFFSLVAEKPVWKN